MCFRFLFLLALFCFVTSGCCQSLLDIASSALSPLGLTSTRKDPAEVQNGCTKNNGEKGICINFNNCPSAKLEVQLKGRPKICSFYGRIPIVCCSKNDLNEGYPNTQSVSDRPSTTINEEPSIPVQNNKDEQVTPSIQQENVQDNTARENVDVPIQTDKDNGQGITSNEDTAEVVQDNKETIPLEDNRDDTLPIPKNEDRNGPIQNNEGNTPYITSSEDKISVRKCREYYPKPPKNRERSDPPVGFIGGIYAKPKEYPHMALLGFETEGRSKWQCGGTLISEQFVLTAAHCIFSRLFGDVKYVRLGELDLSSTTEDADPQDFTVKTVHKHPDYKGFFKYHDIAILELDRPVNITDYIKPACLGFTEDLTGTVPIGMGWGLLDVGGEAANILQSGNLAFVPHEICKRTYGIQRDLKDGIINDWQICADGGGKRRDTCQGDSGGPLQVYRISGNYKYPEIVGITSFGKSCALVPAVYTRVYAYVPWIEKIVWPDL